MTTRFLSPQNLQATNAGLVAVGGSVGRLILPVLALQGAFSILGGGFNDATSSGRAASSAMFQLRASTYGLQEDITRLLLPAIEAVAPVLSNVIDLITDADDATDGWTTRIGLATVGAYGLYRALRAAGVVGAGAATAGAAARGPGSGIGGGVASAGATAGFRGTARQSGARAGGAGAAAGGAGRALGAAGAVAGLGFEGQYVYQNREQYAQTLRDIGLAAALGAVSVAPSAAPAIYNTFNISAADTDDLVRRIQGWMDNGALRTDR